MDSPCFRCPLPDCDEGAKGCLLKRASAARRSDARRGRAGETPAEILAASNEWWRIWKLENDARLSEAALSNDRETMR